MIRTTLKSYFYIIVAFSSIIGSVIATPYISNFVGVASSDPPRLTPTALAQSLPHRVDHHVEIKERTGDQARVEEWMNDADRNCEMSCTYVEFTPGRQGKTGLAYVGDSPMDLSGAQRVHFFLMGEKGGEMVKVYVAGKNPSSAQRPENSQRPDNNNNNSSSAQRPDSAFNEKFARSTGVITLTNDWQRYEISLQGVDLTDITAPFAIELFRRNDTSTMQGVYFKFIEYENQPVDPRFAITANSTDNATALTADNATALTADNATAPNDNGVRGNNNNNNNNNNNTRGQSDDNPGGSNSSSRGRSSDPTIADPTGVDNDNVGNESTTNDATGGTSEEQIGNTTSNLPLESQDNENLAPIATPAASSLVAHPGDTVILDGSLSSDPDGEIITYQWSQSDGPNADIQGADTVTPTVTIPDQDQDDQITIDLVVSDGQAQSDRASVVIDVQYVDEIDGALPYDLRPDNGRQATGWSDASCDGNGAGIIVECLTDSSDSTFVSSNRPSGTTYMLFSFQDPSSVGINASDQITYVTAQVTAKKTGASGFTSLIIDVPTRNEHYSTPSISITSNSFEEYSFTWKSDPITGEPWTLDSLNSLVAGYRHLAGQGSIEISEFSLVVTTIASQEESDEEEPSSLPLEPSIAEEEDSTAEEPAQNDEETEIDEEEPTEEEDAQVDASIENDETNESEE